MYILLYAAVAVAVDDAVAVGGEALLGLVVARDGETKTRPRSLLPGAPSSPPAGWDAGRTTRPICACCI